MRNTGIGRRSMGFGAPALVPLAMVLLLGACGGTKGSGGGDDGGSGPVTDGTDGGSSSGGSDGGGSTTPDGGSGSADAGVELQVTSITPPRGALAGNTLVVLRGRGFVDGFASEGGLEASNQTTIAFGGNNSVDVNVIDDDTIEVKSPAGTRGDVDVTLTNPNGSYTCPKCFTYFEAVQVDRVSPAQGSASGGDTITLSGKGFLPGNLVLVGNNAATNVSVSTDGTSLTAVTPPGTAGSVDVGVVGQNSASFLRRAFVYVAPVSLTALAPVSAPLAGGTVVALSGSGFTSDATVQFGGLAATNVSVTSDTQILATAPAMADAGAVDVTVTTRRGSATLEKGFAYYDASRDVQLFSLAPRQGPVSGGTCAQGPATCLVLTGTGFSGTGLAVRVGSSDATATVVDDHTLKVDLPPGSAGTVDVQVRTDRGGAVLSNAFAYVQPISLASISPKSADASASPPVQAVLSGSGLSASCRVTIGGAPATVASAADDGSSLTVTVPPGSAGARDVQVSCGDPGSLAFQQATLAGAFTFTAPLSILQVDPPTGAIAGNTLVTVYGTGFLPGMKVLFARNPAPQVQVVSPQVALVNTPRGDTGMVDVTVSEGPLFQAVLKAGFGYVDPTNINGGGSGGPMRGILNVTAWNSTYGMTGPIPGVKISINNDQLTGITDDRGQVTFSDPSLLKPVTITGTMKDFATSTIAHIDARNVTLMMEMNGGDGQPSNPPPEPDPATFRGRVCGFKTAPGFTLKAGQRLEAHVYMSAPYVYAAPPFQDMPSPSKVTADCGTYEINTRRYGALALYAEFGVADSTTTPATFTPLLMGIKRGLEASPGKETDGLDIVLDMHRDVSIPIQVDSAQKPPATVVVNMVFSYLDLGGEGVIPLAQTQSTDDTFVFQNHPRVSGEGLMFLNLAAQLDLTTGTTTTPYSFFYRRQYGDPEAGVQIGPMLAFTHLTTPADLGTFTGQLAWEFYDGQKPDVTQVSVQEPAGFSMKPMWDVVVPGTDLAVAMPSSALSSMDPGQMMFWTVTTARSPRFDYDRFGYQQLGVNAWTSFTQDYATFLTP